ncbi:FLYWCH zinc finger domain-containing protein [Phthorimaea operculella]|nr:FLYWCH zinc finger domain-containing protein [Phthorimaea operculella]
MNGTQLLIYKGYSFYLISDNASSQNWACPRRNSRKRKARITTNREGGIVRVTHHHNHTPSAFVIRNGFTFVRNKSGSRMALYNGYSFNSNGESKSTIHWPCVKAYSKCRARLTTSLEGKLTRVTADHNHAPPRFIVCDGVYVKL